MVCHLVSIKVPHFSGNGKKQFCKWSNAEQFEKFSLNFSIPSSVIRVNLLDPYPGSFMFYYYPRLVPLWFFYFLIRSK